MTETPLYCPSLIVRDDDGQFYHPHLPAYEDPDMEGESIAPLIIEQGFEFELVAGEDDELTFPDDLIVEGGQRYSDAFRAWVPLPPAGKGWLLAAIAYTEDGPQALFVRPHANGEKT